MYFGEKDIKHIIQESEKYNVMILMRSLDDAKKAAYEFNEEAGDKTKMVGDRTTLKTVHNNFVYFKSAGQLLRGVDGYRARVIIHIPILEHIGAKCGDARTMKQFQQEGWCEYEKN